MEESTTPVGVAIFGLSSLREWKAQDKLNFGGGKKDGVPCRRDYKGDSCHHGRWRLTDNFESCLVFNLGGNSLLVP